MFLKSSIVCRAFSLQILGVGSMNADLATIRSLERVDGGEWAIYADQEMHNYSGKGNATIYKGNKRI